MKKKTYHRRNLPCPQAFVKNGLKSVDVLHWTECPSLLAKRIIDVFQLRKDPYVISAHFDGDHSAFVEISQSRL